VTIEPGAFHEHCVDQADRHPGRLQGIYQVIRNVTVEDGENSECAQRIYARNVDTRRVDPGGASE